MKVIHSQTHFDTDGFQLKELVTVVAVIALLAVVQLPSLGDNRNSSLANQCRANMRRLSQAWLMYSEDNDGRLVPNNGNSFGYQQTWAAGWLDFSSGTDNTNTTFLVNPEAHGNKTGLLGPYLQKDPQFFLCPSDYSSVTVAGRPHRRVRSVSMNSWMGGNAYTRQDEYQVFQRARRLLSLSYQTCPF